MNRVDVGLALMELIIQWGTQTLDKSYLSIQEIFDEQMSLKILGLKVIPRKGKPADSFQTPPHLLNLLQLGLSSISKDTTGKTGFCGFSSNLTTSHNIVCLNIEDAY